MADEPTTAERYRDLVAEANARGLHIYLTISPVAVPTGLTVIDGTLRIRSHAVETDIETAIGDAALFLDFNDRFPVLG